MFVGSIEVLVLTIVGHDRGRTIVVFSCVFLVFLCALGLFSFLVVIRLYVEFYCIRKVLCPVLGILREPPQLLLPSLSQSCLYNSIDTCDTVVNLTSPSFVQL
jgi:hypothetical protein